MKHLQLTYDFVGHTPAKASEVEADFTDVEDFIEGKLDPDNLVDGDPAQLLLLDDTGKPYYATLFGDVTVSDDGETTIEPDSIVTGMVVDGTLLGADLADATVGDDKLASPNNIVWKTIHEGAARLPQNIGAGQLRFARADGSGTEDGDGVGKNSPGLTFRIDPDELAVDGKDAKLRICGQACTNGHRPQADIQFELHEVTGTGGTGSDDFFYNLDGTRLGNRATIPTPGDNSQEHAETGGFALPDAYGLYVVTFKPSAQTAPNSLTMLSWQVQVHYVDP